jgi:hypothetical protein
MLRADNILFTCTEHCMLPHFFDTVQLVHFLGLESAVDWPFLVIIAGERGGKAAEPVSCPEVRDKSRNTSNSIKM